MCSSDLWLSGWLKKTKNGDSWMSLSVSEIKEKSGNNSGSSNSGLGHKDYGDDF